MSKFFQAGFFLLALMVILQSGGVMLLLMGNQLYIKYHAQNYPTNTPHSTLTLHFPLSHRPPKELRIKGMWYDLRQKEKKDNQWVLQYEWDAKETKWEKTAHALLAHTTDKSATKHLIALLTFVYHCPHFQWHIQAVPSYLSRLIPYQVPAYVSLSHPPIAPPPEKQYLY